MNARLARRLAGLYPEEWRSRYRVEFQAFLSEHPSSLRTIINVIGWAVYERVLSVMRFKMDQRQESLLSMLYAYLCAIAAGINFYWTVDDTPLATVMHKHSALLASWNLIRGGSLLALAAIALACAPILVRTRRMGLLGGSRDVLHWLAVPPCIALLAISWLIIGTKAAGGHWVPTPWDVTGDWTAPDGWPPLATRWVLGSATFVVLTTGLIVSAISIRQVIRRSDLSKCRLLCFTAPSFLLTASVMVMALGALTWGWFAQQYAASDFHSRNGGFFSSTNFASWLASCVVFLLATAISIKGVRSAMAPTTE
jgi:hypothetical protein